MWQYYPFFCNIFIMALVSSLKTYDNYKVFQIIPSSDEEIQCLSDIAEKYNYEFWTFPTPKNRLANLMVAPEKLEEFAWIMNSSGICYQTYIENVQFLIDKGNAPTSSCENSKNCSWIRYHPIEEIDSWLESLADRYREVSVVVAGRSYEGREIKGARLSFGDREKPGIFIEAGIHGNEWIAPATATYLLNEFLTSNDPEVRNLATSYDWYIFPVFNPDGYVYSFTEDRFWRKSRVPNGNGCFGVDLDRNWDYKWMSAGSSNDPCNKNYAGTRPFSELETKTTAEYILSISHKLFAFISFHSYNQLLLLPYGYTTEHLDNYDKLFSIGKKAIHSLQKVYGTTYDIGNPPEVFRSVSGITMDWVKGKLKLPLVFTYELRAKAQYGSVLPPEQIIPNGKEVLNSFLTLFQEASKMGYPNATSFVKNP